MTTFKLMGVELHILTSVLLLPVAAIGHITGLKMHQYILKNDQLFKRFIGGILIIISGLGLIQISQIF